MRLNGTAVRSGTSHTVRVSDGSSFTVDVVAPDGVTTSHYVFTIRTARGGA
jgi:hypothetical protein